MSYEDKIVSVLLDKDGYMVRCGAFENLDIDDKMEIADTIITGGTIERYPLLEFEQKKFTWVWDKPKTNNSVT